ncbi:MAG: hypothetical protein AAF602_32855 [Myxococcota bacterium]
MKREALAYSPHETPLASLGGAELAHELAKQVTRVLGQIVPDTPRGRRAVRDPRQDVLWDCASVLQRVAHVAPSERLLAQLRELLPLLDQVDESDFGERLGRWVAETRDIVRAAR